LLRRAWPMAHPIRRFDKEFRNADIARVFGARLERVTTTSGRDNRAAPVGDFVIWKGNQRGRSKISTGMTGTPRQGSAPKSASSDRVKTLAFAARHARGSPHGRAAYDPPPAVANRLQREIGLDAAADVEGAISEQWPAIMRRLLAPDKGCDLAFKLGVGRLPKKVVKKNISAGIETSASSSKTKCPSARCVANSACVARETAASIWASSGLPWRHPP